MSYNMMVRQIKRVLSRFWASYCEQAYKFHARRWAFVLEERIES